MNTQKGFTLIELIMLIVLIGILSAIIIPRFINMAQKAINATASGTAGALESGVASNYTFRNSGQGGIPIVNCTDAALTMEGGIPANCTIINLPISSSAQNNCTVICTNGSTGAERLIGTATFRGIAVN